MQVNTRRLYRSRDRQLAGVAGGMAEYLNVDPTVSRVLWILAAIVSGGLVIIAYIALAIITPESPWSAAGSAPYGQPGWAQPPAGPTGNPDWAAPAASGGPAPQQARGRGIGAAAIVGVVLIVIGGIALVDAVLPGWSSAVILGPAVILALGAALLVASIRRNGEPAAVPATPATPSTSASEPASPAAGDASWAGSAASYQGTDTQPGDPAALA